MIPKIRNPKYNGDWQIVRLKEVVDRVTRKNIGLKSELPLTISSLDGLVDQRTYFNKVVASKDMSGYYLLKKGEFAYNKSYSKGYDFGSIKRLDSYEEGALSTLYICFSPKEGINSDFLKIYFDSLRWYGEASLICAEGARNHGLLNIGINDFFDMKIVIPTDINEQADLVSLFNKLDEKILEIRRKLELSKEIRAGLLVDIFSQKIRFKDDFGNEFPEWEEKLLSEILTEHGEKYTGNEKVYSVSVSKGLVDQVEHLGRSFAAENLDKYNIVHYGDVVYTKSPTGEFKWGIVKQSKVKSNVVVSPLYGCFTPKTSELGNILDIYFSSSVKAHNYLIDLIRKGAKNTINISNETFLNKKILLPTNENEQKKIIALFTELDKKISEEEMQLQEILTYKKGLLQKVFV
ncbi:restriction endonuclease subunit S [Clostridioides sp. ZZV14-6154]|uniref:restriction endonuclease subunit S n=1 Tax=unclassified Clostridioides TaxID=2635829 RepID=UPI001D1058E5|nr:restriction endonuclease subunit S [Clostridioides sp. ZZV14-6154]MCC0670122.1 restriction endonuclease subunit S [Clostridioides sp. ZZV14-6153]MCC0739168.1 restriction endonuclease subunit S [Clostridioides sp. ZZV14-5902]